MFIRLFVCVVLVLCLAAQATRVRREAAAITAAAGSTPLWYFRTIPVDIDDAIKGDEELSRAVVDGLGAIQNSTCIKFVERTNQKDYVKISFDYPGCNSPVGRQGGEQQLTLTLGCQSLGKVIHEMLHTLGFYHEHARFDRDDYVSVNWDNILQEHRQNFVKVNAYKDNSGATDYDFGSIMHYPLDSFGIRADENTLIPKIPVSDSVEIGQRLALSAIDTLRLNRVYRCDISECESPKIPQHSEMIGTDYSVGSSVTFRCVTGYQLIGAWKRTCTMHGVWTAEAPVCVRSSADNLDLVNVCTFDDPGLCQWHQETDDQLNWDWRHGATPTEGTGPRDDHTLQSPLGHYIYLEGSKPASYGNKARISSNYFTHHVSQRGSTCIRFYYNMYDASKEGMGELKLFITRPGQTIENLWDREGDQGSEWQKADIVLQEPSSFKLTFEATRGISWRSDIAVDDVMVAPCAVLTELDSGVFRHPIPILPLPLGLDPVSPSTECSFESSNACNWVKTTDADDMKWKLPDDHKQIDFASVDTAHSVPGRRAIVKTPILQGKSSYCFSMRYRMKTSGVGKLNLLLQPEASSQLPKQLLSYSDSAVTSDLQGAEWKDTSISVNVEYTSRILVEAVGDVENGGGMVHLQSLNVTDGMCDADVLFSCAFTESTLCGMNVTTSSNGNDWSLSHTRDFVEVTSSGFEHSGTKLQTPPLLLTRAMRHCVNFRYKVLNGLGTLKVVYVSKSVHSRLSRHTELWRGKSPEWTSVSVGFAFSGVGSISFEASMSGVSTETFVLDDVRVTVGQCL